MAETGIVVEVAYALAQQQFLRRVRLPAGSTVAQAIAASAVERECGIDVRQLTLGIWSRRVTAETRVQDGDRVEIYRPLLIDPKQARRLRALRAR